MAEGNLKGMPPAVEGREKNEREDTNNYNPKARKSKYDKEKVRTACDCRAYITQVHGSKHLSGDRYTCPWRGNESESNPSFSVSTTTWRDHREDTGGDIFDLIERLDGCDFKEALRKAAEFARVEPEPVRKKPDWRELWSGAEPDPYSEDDPMNRQTRYNKFRGLPPDLHVPNSKYAIKIPHFESGQKFNALLSPVVDRDGHQKGVHARFVSSGHNGKADATPSRKMYGKMKGNSVHLAEPDGDTIALTEGIETGQAVQHATGLPVWACLSTSGLKSVQLPDETKVVYLFSDNDANQVGQQAAAKLAERLVAEGREAYVIVPDREGNDWLDALNTDGPEAIRQAKEAAEPFELDRLAKAKSKYGDPIVEEETKSGFRYYIDEVATAGVFSEINDIIWDPQSPRFYAYQAETGLWTPKSRDSVAHDVSTFLSELLPRHKWRMRTARVIRAICDHLKGFTERTDVFKQDSRIIHVANGVLEVTGDAVDLRPFRKEDFSRNRSEIQWQPTAECLRFLSELMQPALADDDIDLLQRHAGQCLLGRNPSQKTLLKRGTAGAGKGTEDRVVEGVVGPHNVTELRIRQLTERFELNRYVGKTLLTGKDVPSNFLNTPAAHVLKKLVGGDRVNAEIKGSDQECPLDGDFNAVITTNTRLHVKLDGDAGAWRRRLLIVDYERPKTARPIPNFDEILLQEEGPGILRWAVEGAMKLLADLDAGKGFVVTDRQMKRVDDLLNESNSVRTFVSDCLIGAVNGDVTVAELQSAYLDYCDERGWVAQSQRDFQCTIPDAMLEYHRAVKRTDVKRGGKNQRGFVGVKVIYEKGV